MASGGFVTISVTGLETKQRQLVTWGTKIESLAPVWEQIARDLSGDALRQFEEEGGFYGQYASWAPLAVSTVNERDRLGYVPIKILYRTGTLLSSLANPQGTGHIEVISPSSLEFGTSIFYAIYHQTGTDRMPQRIVLALSWKRQSGIVARLNTYIQEQARLAGLQMNGGSTGGEV